MVASVGSRWGLAAESIKARIGHTTVAAAMRYQHAAQAQDAWIAEALSKLA